MSTSGSVKIESAKAKYPAVADRQFSLFQVRSHAGQHGVPLARSRIPRDVSAIEGGVRHLDTGADRANVARPQGPAEALDDVPVDADYRRIFMSQLVDDPLCLPLEVGRDRGRR